MANTYKWQISQLDAKIHQDNLDNVIYNIHWSLTASDDSEPPYRQSSIGVLPVSYNSENPFIPYSDLTKNEVIGWLESALDVESIKQNLDNKIELQKNPVDEYLIPDWD
jgi:hypothetical protein